MVVSVGIVEVKAGSSASDDSLGLSEAGSIAGGPTDVDGSDTGGEGDGDGCAGERTREGEVVLLGDTGLSKRTCGLPGLLVDSVAVELPPVELEV